MQQKHEIKTTKTEFLKKKSLKFKEILDAEVEIAEFICHHDVKDISGDPEKKIHKSDNSHMCMAFWSFKN